MPDNLLIDPEGGSQESDEQKPGEQQQAQQQAQQQGEKLPEGYEGLSPAQIAQKAEDERIRREQAEQSQQRTNEAYLQAVMGAFQGGGQQQAEEKKPELPDPEEDPEGYRDAVIAQKVQEGVTRAVKPLQDRFLSAEAQTYNQAIQGNKERMRNDPVGFPHAAEYEKEIDEYLAQFPVNMQALPNARQEAYDRIDGVHRRRKAAEDHARQSTAISDGAGRSSASRGDHPAEGEEQVTKLSDRERFTAQRERMSDGMFRDMQGPGIMDIDDYQRLKEREKNNGRRAG